MEQQRFSIASIAREAGRTSSNVWQRIYLKQTELPKPDLVFGRTKYYSLEQAEKLLAMLPPNPGRGRPAKKSK